MMVLKKSLPWKKMQMFDIYVRFVGIPPKQKPNIPNPYYMVGPYDRYKESVNFFPTYIWSLTPVKPINFRPFIGP